MSNPYNLPVHDIVLFYSVILYIPMIYLDDLWVIPLKGTYRMGVYYIIQSGWDPQAGCNLGPDQNSQLDFAAVFDKILRVRRES